ncbi:MAG: 2-C-methyl-D-erythritol 4-phosphate cytidylyltransferase [Phycisphaerae bacterium]|nr:2-C-methyl-D-erythritol 4-phosphate cytidylyltransferase [Phycisphaerae bacterium]
MAKVSVIVPGAGAGKRFVAAGGKIFQPLNGRPVFIRTLEVFVTRRDVCQVLLVVAPGNLHEVRRRFGSQLDSMGVTVVAGGATRSESVRNALAHLSDQAELVCVHDAVRPCVSPLWVDAVFAQAQRAGAAILACPVHGTLKRVSPAGVVQGTLPRAEAWEAQTPQVFRRDWLLAAYATGAEATDDARLVEATGREVSVVPGDVRNIKITTAADLAIAAAVIDTLPR